MKFMSLVCVAAMAFAAGACQSQSAPGGEGPYSEGEAPFTVTEVARFDSPWAMTFLPDRSLLVTEKSGKLKWWANGAARDVAGVPAVKDDGQGGLADVVLAPDYAASNTVYLSWIEAGSGGNSGGVVGRAKLVLDGAPHLEGLNVIWRQDKVDGDGHFSQRLAFSPDGKYLFVTSGERQKFDPAQDLKLNLGKVLRLLPDGTPAPGNPFAGKGGNSDQVWSYGHRNLYGLAFDKDGRLWEHEMGPQGGDEVNLIVEGRNYGYPIVSNGDHYDGREIPDHPTRPEFEAPKLWWNPSISPSSMLIYSGSKFPQWKGDMFITALSGQSLIRVDLDGDKATKVDRWDMETRVREVEQGPDGDIWLLEDGSGDPGGRLLRLTPKG
ncbi:hypothetical protein ABAC460_18730 [Asticcacaulis sp. AC460]|uniref:PQQ-dependent sugar dehydrogenase n=1 Tax=Asticcacaulis sp. AC460 TaxID=1282360 RepID=UPI0003C3CB36|nr:PQQ-dependent sugar dehydrogenase [Asticcacaulis sp. AC460]ESQ87710.1 hypothetical protein ABAC460_18730 [Asticcacaulis sp. AC460]